MINFLRAPIHNLRKSKLYSATHLYTPDHNREDVMGAADTQAWIEQYAEWTNPRPEIGTDTLVSLSLIHI